MPTSLLDALRRMVTPSMVHHLSEMTGIPTDAVDRGLSAAIPATLAPLAARAHDAAFIGWVYSLAADPANDASLLDHPERLTERARALASESRATGSLQALLFATPVGDGVGRFAGLRASQASWLMALALPLVLSGLNLFIRQRRLDPTGLGQWLEAERSSIAAALPTGLSQRLAAAAAGEPTGVDALERMAEPLLMPRPAPQSRSRGWLAPALAALLLFGVLWILLRPGDTLDDIAGAAADAVPVGTTGYVTRVLPGGTDLRIPTDGTEMRLLSFLEGSAPVTEDRWFEFDRLNFESSSARVRPDSNEQLSDIAAILLAYPQAHVTIGGYTDNADDPVANRELSGARANAVMNRLRDLGIAPSRMASAGYGDAHPIADNGTAAGRARNRRVAIRVMSR